MAPLWCVVRDRDLTRDDSWLGKQGRAVTRLVSVSARPGADAGDVFDRDHGATFKQGNPY